MLYTLISRHQAKQAFLRGHIMTYLNRLGEDSQLMPLVKVLPRTLRRGEDYWAIFVGTFTPDELLAASQAHYIDGPLVECWLEWYIQNNAYFQDFKKVETEQNTAATEAEQTTQQLHTSDNGVDTKQTSIQSRFATELESHLSNTDMEEAFGPEFQHLFNRGEDHHIATPAEGLHQQQKQQQTTRMPTDAVTDPPAVTVQYSRTGFVDRNTLEEDSDSEDDGGDAGYASQHTGNEYASCREGLGCVAS